MLLHDVVEQITYLNRLIEFLVHANPENQKLLDFALIEIKKDEKLN